MTANLLSLRDFSLKKLDSAEEKQINDPGGKLQIAFFIFVCVLPMMWTPLSANDHSNQKVVKVLYLI